MGKPKCIMLLCIVSVLCLQAAAYAGPYTDDLTKCIVESTSPEDRVVLMRWLFTAIARHPQLQSMAQVSEDQGDNANRGVADLFMRLLTETCREQTAKSMKYEGKNAIQASFEVLGKVAATEMFSSPEVAAGMSGLEKYFDQEKLKSTLEIK